MDKKEKPTAAPESQAGQSDYNKQESQEMLPKNKFIAKHARPSTIRGSQDENQGYMTVQSTNHGYGEYSKAASPLYTLSGNGTAIRSYGQAYMNTQFHNRNKSHAKSRSIYTTSKYQNDLLQGASLDHEGGAKIPQASIYETTSNRFNNQHNSQTRMRNSAVGTTFPSAQHPYRTITDPQVSLNGGLSVDSNKGIVDIETEQLTYKQAKSIKQQVQQDCQLLKNRVRMLKAEMSKARKKIQVTQKKTADINTIRVRNDEKYYNQVVMKSQEQRSPTTDNMEKRLKLNQDIKEKRYKLFLDRRQEADVYKKQKQKYQEIHHSFQVEFKLQNYENKMRIRQQEQIGIEKRQEYLENKRTRIIKDKGVNINSQKSEIYSYEREAEQLELEEARLLEMLKETQMKEQKTLHDLKNSLIESSVPYSIRAKQLGSDSQKA